MTTQPYTHHDTASMAWQDHVIGGSIRKVLYVDPQTKGYVHLRFAQPGKPEQSVRRYHRTVRETFYFLGGDLPDWEFKSAADTKGWDVTFREGHFMDRPPRSVHGRGSHQTSEAGGTFLIWSTHGDEFEADLKESIYLDFDGNFDNHGRDFTVPNIVDTAKLDWVPHPTVKGWKQRMVSLNEKGAPPAFYPVTMVHLPAGSAAGQTLTTDGHRRWLYVVNGTMTLQDGSQDLSLRKGAYLDWCAPAKLSVKDAGGEGCTVLCVGHALAG